MNVKKPSFVPPKTKPQLTDVQRVQSSLSLHPKRSIFWVSQMCGVTEQFVEEVLRGEKT